MVKRKQKKKDEHTFLSVNILKYDVRVGASINYEARDSKHYRDEAQVYKFDSALDIEGVSLYPENRKDEKFYFSIYGDEPHKDHFSMTLDDCHARDERGARQYQTKRGIEFPVYKIPKGIGMIQKVRGENTWTGWLWVKPRTLSDMLTILHHREPTYLSIHELKEGRSRWIVDFSLQTMDPSEKE